MTAADFEVCRVTFFKILQVAGLRSSLVAVVVAHSSCGLLPRPSGLVKRCCLYLAFILIYRNAFFFIYFFSFSGKVLWVMKFFSFCLCLCICKLFFFFYFYHLPAHCRFAKKLLLSDLPTVFFFVVVVEVVCNRCTLIFFFFFSLSYSGFVIAETKERLHKSRKRKKKKEKAATRKDTIRLFWGANTTWKNSRANNTCRLRIVRQNLFSQLEAPLEREEKKRRVDIFIKPLFNETNELFRSDAAEQETTEGVFYVR